MQTARPAASPATPPDDEFPVIHIDMDQVYARAMSKPWTVAFECDGAEFIWHGKATSSGAAELIARRELADECAGFSRFGARLMQCVEG